MSQPSEAKDRRVWTFAVSGGRPFKIQVPGNPVMEYDGGLEVLKVVISEDQVEEIKAVLLDHDCKIIMAKTEVQTEEQEKLREDLAGVQRGDIVWPTEKCPECSFFDPHLNGVWCGAEGWPEESVHTLLATGKGRQDILACPLQKGRQHLVVVDS